MCLVYTSRDMSEWWNIWVFQGIGRTTYTRQYQESSLEACAFIYSMLITVLTPLISLHMMRLLLSTILLTRISYGATCTAPTLCLTVSDGSSQQCSSKDYFTSQLSSELHSKSIIFLGTYPPIYHPPPIITHRSTTHSISSISSTRSSHNSWTISSIPNPHRWYILAHHSLARCFCI